MYHLEKKGEKIKLLQISLEIEISRIERPFHLLKGFTLITMVVDLRKGSPVNYLCHFFPFTKCRFLSLRSHYMAIV